MSLVVVKTSGIRNPLGLLLQKLQNNIRINLVEQKVSSRNQFH
jgi:hypothetical protein